MPDRTDNKSVAASSAGGRKSNVQVSDSDIPNPGGLMLTGASFLFVAAIPLTTYIAQSGGSLERVINNLCSAIVYVGSAGAKSRVAGPGVIAALSTLYIAVTYAFTGAASAGAVAAGNAGGRDNLHPRAQELALRGLPLRLKSAHHHLMEMFGGYVLAAALALTQAQPDPVIVNLLGLHVICKIFVHYPAYVLGVNEMVGHARSAGHILATASVINAAMRVALQNAV